MATVTNGIITTIGYKVLNDLMSNSSPTKWPLYVAYGEGVSGEQEAFGAVSTGDYFSLRATSATTLLAQSFQVDNAANVSSVKIALKKICFWDVYRWICPSGDVWVEIHSSTSGTSGTKDASTNIVGTASDDVAVSGIHNWDWVEFDFTGTKPPLTADTTYYIVLYGDFTVDADKHVNWAYKGSDGYDDGDAYTVNSSMSWSSAKSGDFSFKIYGEGEVTISKHNTELAGEVERALATVVDTNARLNLSKTFSLTADVTIMEAGVFDEASGGNMVYHGGCDSSNKVEASSGDDFVLEMTLTPEQG